MELNLPESPQSLTLKMKSLAVISHTGKRQPLGAEVTTEGNLYQEFQTPAGREQEMGCRNQCPSIFQADGCLRRLRRHPGDGTEYRCAAYGQSLEGTCLSETAALFQLKTVLWFQEQVGR